MRSDPDHSSIKKVYNHAKKVNKLFGRAEAAREQAKAVCGADGLCTIDMSNAGAGREREGVGAAAATEALSDAREALEHLETAMRMLQEHGDDAHRGAYAKKALEMRAFLHGA